MAQADITINGIDESDDDMVIDDVVLLNNVNNGGETTFFWQIVDQPPGPDDVLSSTNTQASSFTPQKEGTYLIQLTVNTTLVDRKIVGIRQIKSGIRIPAAQETVQAGTRGWAQSAGILLQLLDDRAADSGLFIAPVATAAPPLSVGQVCRAVSTEVLKAGLPGQEFITGWSGTNATIGTNIDQQLAVAISALDGSAPPFAPGEMVIFRLYGPYDGLTGAPASGDSVFVSNTGFISTVPGTVPRKIGNVTRSSAGTYDVWVDGSGGPDGAVLTLLPPVNVDKSPAVIGAGLTAARFDHKHDINTAVVGSITIGAVAAEGVATTLARSDHTHGFASPAVPVNVDKSAASAGVAATVARSDHKHDITTATPGGILVGDVAAEGVATFLTRSDHKHSLAAPAAPVNVDKSAASAGVSTNVARQDHKHDISTATPVSVSNINTEGVASTLARSDHTHLGMFLQTVFAEITVDTTTLSSTFVSLLSQVITTQTGTNLLIYLTSGVSNNTNDRDVFFRVQVDGVTKRGVGVECHANGEAVSAAMVLKVTGLLAGAHTVLVQWRASTGGANTAQIRPVTAPDAEHFSLLLEEVTV
jgi:hypothetical protein